MGQYFVLANLTKREFLDCYELGHGAKAVEQAWGTAGMGQALLLLLGTGMGRGGGDFRPVAVIDRPTGDPLTEEGRADFERWIKESSAADEAAREVLGRWGGDQIVFVGDYAEDGDKPDIIGYGALWDRIRGYVDEQWCEDHKDDHSALLLAAWRREEWTEISGLVRPYMESNFGFKYEEEVFTSTAQDGTVTKRSHWRIKADDDEPATLLAPDIIITGGSE